MMQSSTTNKRLRNLLSKTKNELLLPFFSVSSAAVPLMSKTKHRTSLQTRFRPWKKMGFKKKKKFAKRGKLR
jgi:hypothetical protein